MPAVRGDGSYDPETITLLRSVLDAAWNSLSPAQQARISKSVLAERLWPASRAGSDVDRGLRDGGEGRGGRAPSLLVADPQLERSVVTIGASVIRVMTCRWCWRSPSRSADGGACGRPRTSR